MSSFSEYMGKSSKKIMMTNCTNERCKSTHVQGAFFKFNIEAHTKNFFEHRNLVDLLSEHNDRNAHIAPGFIDDVTSSSKFKYWKENFIKNVYGLCLLWNLDGTSWKHSSKSSVWLFQAHILNLPIHKKRGLQFVRGIYYSRYDKPYMKSFFRPFADAIKYLSTDGIKWYDKKTDTIRKSIVIALISSWDAPARLKIIVFIIFPYYYKIS